MNEQNEIRRILLEILQVGLLRIRACGNSVLPSANPAEACSIEADHLHNLPTLIQSFRREELLFYYNVERPACLSATTSHVDDFKPLWDQLDRLISRKEQLEPSQR